MLNEQDILKFLSGQSDSDLQARVKDARADLDFSKELDAFQVVWDETEKLKDYVSFDTAEAWGKLEGLLEEESDDKGVIGTAEQEEKPAADVISIKPRKNRQRWWLAAASVILLAGASYWFLTRDPYIHVQGDTWAEITTLPDGSTVTLSDQNSALHYLRRFAEEPERRVRVEGNVVIDVESDPNKAFIVENYDAAVQVLGTEFKISSVPSKSELENIEGKIKMFEILDTANNVKLTKPGEKAIFIPGKKIDKIELPKPVVVIPDTIGVYINIPDLVDYLQWEYDEELVVSPREPFGEGIIKVDTAQGLRGILMQLDSTASIVWRPGIGNSYNLYDLRVKNQ